MYFLPWQVRTLFARRAHNWGRRLHFRAHVFSPSIVILLLAVLFLGCQISNASQYTFTTTIDGANSSDIYGDDFRSNGTYTDGIYLNRNPGNPEATYTFLHRSILVTLEML